MKYTAAINNKTLKMNTGDLLKKIDKEGNGTYSIEELKVGIKESVSIFARPLINDNVMGKISKILDTNQDGKITDDELSKLLKDNYGLKLEDAKKMNVKDLANYLQDHAPKKKDK